MDNLIHLLPDPIANQIAAGEVIQRPASVVKELVENAVDAGATKIDIEIVDAGKTLIRVIDNGRGMAPMDARMAFERHATSKIRSAEDLFKLTTMGFRGEALPSIVAVSQLTLQTRTADEELGVRIDIEGSKVTSTQSVMCAVGANFSVKNLFFNIPARRKFLKSDDTEYRHILTEVQRIAAVHPTIAISLKHNDSYVLRLTPSTLKQRIVDLFGQRLNPSLLLLESETPIVQIQGFISRTDACRKRAPLQYFYVNGRYMRHPYFHRMVINAYAQLIPVGENPEYFIYLDVDPATIDVNIHPTKTEIKFEAEAEIGKLLSAVIRETLMKGATVPTIDFEEKVVDIPLYTPMDEKEMTELPIVSAQPVKLPYSAPIELPNTSLPEEFQLPDMSDWDSFYRSFEEQRVQSTPSHTPVAQQPRGLTFNEPLNNDPEESLLLPEGTPTLPSPMPLVVAGYALYNNEDQLHIVHLERAKTLVTYHSYKQNMNNRRQVSYRLLFPELLDLGVQEEAVLQRHLELLTTLGFDVAEMGGHAYAINAIPEGFPAGAEADVLLELLHDCEECEREPYEVLQDKLLLSMTYKRIQHEGIPTEPEKVQDLLQAWQQLPHRTHTPDGKLIMSLLPTQELRKRFK